jgi:glycosyltransferase involved in cell wall biosynthesis
VEAPGDDDALAERIVTLLEDAELWDRFSRAGVTRARTRFDLRTQSRKLEELYLERVLRQ